MIVQKKYCIALLFGMSTISYGMDNFFADEEKKKIHPMIQCAFDTCRQMGKLAREMKDELKADKNKQEIDTVFTASGGRFRTVGRVGPIIVVEKVVAKL